MAETVLITGASGMVGTPTVAQFAAAGWQVVATAHRASLDSAPAGVTTYQVDLADPVQVQQMVSEVAPKVIVHLAAVIPPQIYRDPAHGRRVNVGATAALVAAAEALPNPPRLVYASTGSIYGPRNPHRLTELLGPDTPAHPYEVYGFQKQEAEQIVRSSRLDWVSLRLGGVFSIDPAATPFDADTLYFGSVLPIDGRVHTVDARDAAAACVAAATADVVGEILMIGGDASHLQRQADLMKSLGAARGVVGYPLGRRGDPDSDTDWYAYGDWMDVTRAQQALGFQHYSWSETMAGLRVAIGWQYYPTRMIGPLIRAFIKRLAAYRKSPGQYADVWGAIRARFGEPTGR